ncbi:AbiJ-NTD4 domain-containing protein [Methanocaldococcus sp. 16A]
MKLFSQRMGFNIKNIQINSIDDGLRNRLWNALKIYYWDKIKETKGSFISINRNIDILSKIHMEIPMENFFKRLWDSYFKEPIDTLPDTTTMIDIIKNYFFSCEWYEVYDFIEFVANNYPDEKVNLQFMIYCNSVLEQELSAYRFVGGKITPITSEYEISEIEGALEKTNDLKAVNIHLKRALELLADRKSPDYRNSIKESISAVEAICKLITGDEKATLGQALKKIEDKIGLHPALKKAFSNLYGYTSDADGIRHALLDEPNLSFEDAKFMLVSCSAFINYLIAKASKAGIKIGATRQIKS